MRHPNQMKFFALLTVAVLACFGVGDFGALGDGTLFVLAGFIDFFGSESNSSSNSSSETNTQTTTVSGGASEGSFNISGAGNIELIDPGLVKAAFDFAGKNQESVNKAQTAIVAGYGTLAQEFGRELNKFAESAIKDDSARVTEVTKWIVGGLAVVAGAFFFSRRRVAA